MRPVDRQPKQAQRRSALEPLNARSRDTETGARRQLLTREDEIRHAQIIERGERAVLEAIAAEPAALRTLARICEEVKGGTLDLAELVRDPTDAEYYPERVATVILDAMHGMSRRRSVARPRARAAISGQPARAAAERFLQAVLGNRLSRRAIDAICAELESSAQAMPRAKKLRLRATAAAIGRAQQQAEHSRSVLIEANLGLVVWMASRRGRQNFPAVDLIQEGNLGLMRAVEKFDYRRGFRFNTYAAWWIRHFMNRSLSDQSRIIRLPVHLLETRHRIARRAQEFRQQHGREPTPQELANETGTPPQKVSEILSIPRDPLSLDAPVRSDGDARRCDFVADGRAISPIESISSRQVQARLREMLRSLTPREQEVLARRFGLDGFEGVTLEQIGKRFSLSRERIRQIESEALAKLRKQAENENLAAHLTG